MFFTPDLLSRRDSGFGLLWLAATLGSKTAFKKLPKRSVMTADIAQLCDLIAEPAEPLALRLSSNLMYGVVRVYKVKQEIFIADVNSCVTALKKMVQDMRQHTVADDDLLLAQITARPHVVTIQQDPVSAHALMFDALFAGWDEVNEDEMMTDDDDENFNPKAGPKKKIKARPAKESTIETARRDPHILSEDHDHLVSGSLSRSFEGVFGSGPGDFDLSTSQVDGGLAFDDNFLGTSYGFDLAGSLGDELAKELGWEINEIQSRVANDRVNFNLPPVELKSDIYPFDGDLQLDARPCADYAAAISTPRHSPQKSFGHNGSKDHRATASPRNENHRASSVASFARAFLSQDLINDEEVRQPLADITTDNQQSDKPERKRKRARLLLDARTELTDAELKVARAKYLESQRALRKEMAMRRMEKDSSKIIDDLIWGVPRGLNAEPLIRFWQDNFKVQVQARTSNIEVHLDQGLQCLIVVEIGARNKIIRVERPKKRARKEVAQADPIDRAGNFLSSPQPLFEPQNFDVDFAMDQAVGMVSLPFDGESNALETRRRSSSEPGQGRQRSRASSVARGSQFGIEVEARDSIGSQKSMFPWDNAGASSSIGGHMLSDQVDFAQVDTRLRSSSLSRKGSPFLQGSPLPGRSRSGSILAGAGGVSPAGAYRSQAFYSDPVVACDAPDASEESQRSEIALVTLEKDSYNFLEYAKMQQQANPGEDLKFATIVPSITSTRHVAAAAFYHCLVLATKNLLSLKQTNPYGSITVSVV